MSDVRKGWTPSNWASWKPFGIGEQRPNNFYEVFRAAFENRDEAAYAWRILRDGVCDGCALGTSGMKDWTLDGVHLCNIRLRLLRLNTMGPINESLLGDVDSLREKSSAELRELGRLPHPMRRRRGEAGFSRISWDNALDTIAARARAAGGDRIAFYLTSRGMPNEAYYCAQKAARAMGTNNVDNAARVCHSPSTVGLKQGLGVAATTCSYADFLKTDLIVFIGSNVANNQPVATKYLHYAKKNGARILVVNPYREPGMERYWIPSVVESALFGTKLADRFFEIDIGSDAAFLSGALKHLIETGAVDDAFISEHTNGFDTLRDAVSGMSWDDFEQACGLSAEEIKAFADEVARAQRAVFVWSMGITQHANGVDNVRAIVNLALSRGFVGREGCGLMPIRGHSGVQGGAEMGAYATVFPGGEPISEESAARWSERWGFEIPPAPGATATEMVEMAGNGGLEVLFSVGGNFLEILPEPEKVQRALETIPLRVHMDIVLSTQMLVDPAEDVILLPAATRYETIGGVTETSTERRVIFSPEIPGRRIGEARPEWEVFTDLGRRAQPEAAAAFSFSTTADVRAEIAAAIPMYDGIQHLAKKGDQFQYGGPHLCADGRFPTPSGKAQFLVPNVDATAQADDTFRVTTRRGKQFNSMVQEPTDQLTGAGRDAVLINPEDAARLGLRDGDAVQLRNEIGSYVGRAFCAPIKSGNAEVHWPEGNVLIESGSVNPDAGIPDYNATVTIEKVAPTPPATD